MERNSRMWMGCEPLLACGNTADPRYDAEERSTRGGRLMAHGSPPSVPAQQP